MIWYCMARYGVALCYAISSYRAWHGMSWRGMTRACLATLDVCVTSIPIPILNIYTPPCWPSAPLLGRLSSSPWPAAREHMWVGAREGIPGSREHRCDSTAETAQQRQHSRGSAAEAAQQRQHSRGSAAEAAQQRREHRTPLQSG